MTMSSDTLAIVPTKGRPQFMKRLISSIRRSAHENIDIELVICESEGAIYSETIETLRWMAANVNDGYFDGVFMTVVHDTATYVEKINYAAEEYADRYKYLFIPNDDHEVMTPGFDVAFKEAIGDAPFGLAYGFDGIWTEGQVATAPFMTASIWSALGYVALPSLFHILVDNVWVDLAKDQGACHYLPEVLVQHHHIDNGEAEHDATYAETNGNEQRNQHDREAWWEWLANGRITDAAKLRSLEHGNG
jgi:hypothetical protein